MIWFVLNCIAWVVGVSKHEPVTGAEKHPEDTDALPHNVPGIAKISPKLLITRIYKTML